MDLKNECLKYLYLKKMYWRCDEITLKGPIRTDKNKEIMKIDAPI